MKVTLVKYTTDALEVLLFTKSTRLRMSGTSLEEIKAWSFPRKMEEWQYMQGTIKSSWEFIDFIFAIEDVSRAFTQQLERHRIGTSFAEQSLRAVEVRNFEYIVTGTCKENAQIRRTYNVAMDKIRDYYEELLYEGAYTGDARGILPLNIAVNIVFKANLRTLNQMCAERLCYKTQGEFQDVMRELRREIVSVYPWAEPALRVHCAQHGTCAFPAFRECPIKGAVFNPETGQRWDEAMQGCSEIIREEGFARCQAIHPLPPATREEIQTAWLTAPRVEARPVFREEQEEKEQE